MHEERHPDKVRSREREGHRRHVTTPPEPQADHLTSTRKPMRLHDMPWKLRTVTLPPVVRVGLLDRYLSALLVKTRVLALDETRNGTSVLEDILREYLSVAMVATNPPESTKETSRFTEDIRLVLDYLKGGTRNCVADSLGSTKREKFTESKHSVSDGRIGDCQKSVLVAPKSKEAVEKSFKMSPCANSSKLELEFCNFLSNLTRIERLEKSQKMSVCTRLSDSERSVVKNIPKCHLKDIHDRKKEPKQCPLAVALNKLSQTDNLSVTGPKKELRKITTNARINSAANRSCKVIPTNPERPVQDSARFDLQKRKYEDLPANSKLLNQESLGAALSKRSRIAHPAAVEPKKEIKMLQNRSINTKKRKRNKSTANSDQAGHDFERETSKKKLRKRIYAKPIVTEEMKKFRKMEISRKFASKHYWAKNLQKSPSKDLPILPETRNHDPVRVTLQRSTKRDVSQLPQPTQPQCQPQHLQPPQQDVVAAEVEEIPLEEFLGKRAPTRPLKMSRKISINGRTPERKTSTSSSLDDVVISNEVLAVLKTFETLEESQVRSLEQNVPHVPELENPGKSSEIVPDDIENIVKSWKIVPDDLENPEKSWKIVPDIENPEKSLKIVPDDLENPEKSSKIVPDVLENPEKSWKIAPDDLENPEKYWKIVPDDLENPEKSREIVPNDLLHQYVDVFSKVDVESSCKYSSDPLQELILSFGGPELAWLQYNFYKNVQVVPDNIKNLERLTNSPITNPLENLKKTSKTSHIISLAESLYPEAESSYNNVPSLPSLTEASETSRKRLFSGSSTKKKNYESERLIADRCKNVACAPNTTKTPERTAISLENSRETQLDERLREPVNFNVLFDSPHNSGAPTVLAVTETITKQKMPSVKLLESPSVLYQKGNPSNKVSSMQQLEDGEYLRNIFRDLQEIRSVRLLVDCQDDLEEVEKEYEQDFYTCYNQFVSKYNVLPHY